MDTIIVDFPEHIACPPIKINLPSNKKIAVMLSGGADSTFLFWLLYKENLKRNLSNEILPFCIDRPNGSIIHSKNVIDFLRRYFEKDIPYPITVGNSALHHSKQVWSGIEDVKHKFKINEIYIGGTQNPPIGMIEGEYPNRNDPGKHRYDKVPFFHCDKRHITYLYLANNLLDLFDITHSCGSFVYGKCGECFSCNERQWGLRELPKFKNG